MNTKSILGKSLFALTISASPFVIGIANAQTSPAPAAPASDPAAPAGDSAAVADIIVTGSRLASRGYQAPSPVTVIGAEDLKASRVQTPEALLIQYPQFIGDGFDASGNGANKGVAALNMRGLGEKRSLTLVNGRRYTVSGNDNITDLNTIPAALISRVEVVTGGSSAVYGSDALAGVVNFVIRDNFQGLTVDASRRWDQTTGTPSYSADLTFGSNFADDRGNAVISVNYYDRGAITRGQYYWAAPGLSDGCVTPSSFNPHGPGTPVAIPAGQTCTSAGGVVGFVTGFSGSTLPGRFAGIPLYNSAQSNPGLNAALLAAGLQNMTGFGFTFDQGSTAPRPALDPADRYNNSPPNLMQSPLRRWMVNSFFNYKLNGSMTAYAEAHFSNYLTHVQLAPNVIGGNFLIDVNNPYVSAQFREVLRQVDLAETATTTVPEGSATYTNAPGDGRALLNINKRFPESFPRAETQERNVFRIALGLKGDVAPGIAYDVYYSYARTQESDLQTGNFSISKTQAALLSQGGAAPVLNPFGPTSVTPAAIAATSVSAISTVTNVQEVVAGNLTGSPFSLPAGPVDFNVGVEWRRNALTSSPDGLLLLNDIVGGVGAVSNIRGSTTVTEGYAETRIPILHDTPFFQRLTATGAVRYSKYDTKGVGGVWTYSAGLQWQPVRDLMVRGQYQRAIRAPNVVELFGSQVSGSAAVPDPCSSRSDVAKQTAAVRALCIATGVPAANVFTSIVQPNVFVQFQTGGNPNVGPETSDTYTLGVAFTPRAIPGLALSIDAYRVNVDGAIAGLALNSQNLLNLCYYTIASATSQFCAAVHRDAVTGEINGLNGAYINQTNANTGGIRVSGIDFNAQYAFNVGFSPFGGTSRISMNAAISYTGEYTFTPVQALPTIKNHCAGAFGAVCGLPAPKWKGITRITWDTGPVSFTVRNRFTGSVRRDVPTAVSTNRIPVYDYVDLSASVKLPERFEIYGGINNITATAPPILGSGAPTWGLNTAPGVYEIYGRTFFIGFTKRF